MGADNEWLVLIPSAAVPIIGRAGSRGNVTCRISAPERAARILALSDGNDLPQRLQEDPAHFLSSADFHGAGSWYRTDPDIAVLSYFLGRQNQMISFEGFRNAIPELRDPGAGWYIGITFTERPPEIAPGRQLPQFAAWRVSRAGVSPLQCDVETERAGMRGIAEHWPIQDLQQSRVLLVGLGSIGGATAIALAGYGVGNIDLMDPDRLRYHNVPRHVCPATSVGKFKVHAVADHLERLWPETTTRAVQADAIVDADLLRPLIEAADVVVCTVDGVEPRRVISYLCKRASTPLVLACVLADGRYGEILRMRPFPEIGCLECQRRALAENGQIDLETTLDRGYGEGTRHNPMTAVGSDLHLVGSIAAKSAIATVLASKGYLDQTLEDDNAVIALRPEAGWAPPFNSARGMSFGWYSSTPPYSDCRACARP